MWKLAKIWLLLQFCNIQINKAFCNRPLIVMHWLNFGLNLTHV